MAVPIVLVRRVVIDVLCLTLVYVPWMVLHGANIKPFYRGFFCNDESLKHPFFKSSISGGANTALCVIAPILVILVVECVHYFTKKRANKTPAHREVDGISLHPIIYLCYNAIMAFLIGCAIQQTIVNIMKFSVGRLRPHFIDVCKPNWTAIECMDPASNQYRYVEDAQCTGTNKKHLADVRLSFPSGHSSMSTYSMLFIGIYLQARLTWRGSRLLRPFLQAGLIYVCVYIAVTRIGDYKHHWSDVLGGVFIGALFAILSGRYVWDFFEQPNWKKIVTAVKQSRNGTAPYYDTQLDDSNPPSGALGTADV